MGTTSRRITFVIGLVLGGFFLWLSVRDVNLEAVAEALKSANFLLAFPFLTLLGVFYWLKAVRWSYLLQPTRKIGAMKLAPAMMIGFAGNNLLPIRLGELIRVYALGNEENISKSTVLGTVILERVFDLVSMLALLTVALHATSFVSPDFEAARSLMLAAAVIAIAATYGIAVAPKWLLDILQPPFALLPDRLQRGVQSKLVLLQQGFAAITQSPGHVLLRISLNSLLQWALLASCIYLAVVAFDIEVAPSAAVLVLGLVVAGISLPSAPGFIGTVEYCFVLGLGLFGVSADLALSIGIYYHAITFLSVTFAGAVALRYLNLSTGELARDAVDTKQKGQ